MDIKKSAIPYDIKDVTKELIGQQIYITGWVRTCHEVGKKIFFTVYSGGHLAKCFYSVTEDKPRVHLTKNTSVEVFGEVKANFTKDSFDCEVHVSECKVFGDKAAPGFEIDKETTSESVLLDHGHLLLREPERAATMKIRAELLRITREYYYQKSYTEVTPPTLVQTQVEGGSTLFELDYFGEKAYLTQSSQLYLETAIPVFNKVYCIASSYRAEKSNTRRHLSEYTHIEAELAWIDFDRLLSEIEDLIIYIMEGFNKVCVPILQQFSLPAESVAIPAKPFKRLAHSEAIDILREHNVLQESGRPFTYDDDIPDAPERFVCEKVGQGAPIFLTRFPAHMKSFYMERHGEGLTNSCDLLYPGVGEIVGGSMRLWKHDELLEGFKREGISPAPYAFYTDQSLYGPTPHGGYGLGFERIIMGLMPKIVHKVRQACLYPRFNGRCTP
ncbi:asparaginyl-tRNA synthetase [Nematocida displodere]|uniref:asparagine--tRNA ligase n=1 Tax=Nematocida displodere TaxID=1805483 RepID=A0A177EJ64_9MICR|nr:asparaginyl-tRNA synthetase [Nematocida displodere]